MTLKNVSQLVWGCFGEGGRVMFGTLLKEEFIVLSKTGDRTCLQTDCEEMYFAIHLVDFLCGKYCRY